MQNKKHTCEVCKGYNIVEWCTHNLPKTTPDPPNISWRTSLKIIWWRWKVEIILLGFMTFGIGCMAFWWYVWPHILLIMLQMYP